MYAYPTTACYRYLYIHSYAMMHVGILWESSGVCVWLAVDGLPMVWERCTYWWVGARHPFHGVPDGMVR